jgi:dolichol kinase
MGFVIGFVFITIEFAGLKKALWFFCPGGVVSACHRGDWSYSRDIKFGQGIFLFYLMLSHDFRLPSPQTGEILSRLYSDNTKAEQRPIRFHHFTLVNFSILTILFPKAQAAPSV